MPFCLKAFIQMKVYAFRLRNAFLFAKITFVNTNPPAAEVHMGKFARIFFLFIPAFLLMSCGSVSGTISVSEETEYEVKGREKPAMGEVCPDETGTICVSVIGCVGKPGIYIMPEGSRIYEVVNAAGGVDAQGDATALNMASVMTDGQKIVVPEKQTGERTESGTGSTALANGKVNLNSATLSELMTLGGIGKSKAESIISYRESAGPFKTIEDIMNVSGIKEGVFEKIKDDIVVY